MNYAELQEKLNEANKALDGIRAVLHELDTDPSMSKAETIRQIHDILDINKWGCPV